MRSLMSLLAVAAVLPVVEFAVSHEASPSAVGTTRELDAVRVWSAFRKAYPYSMQTIALERTSTGEYVIIVSEPPPHVTRDALRAIWAGEVAVPRARALSRPRR